ncbi:hypothetical protein BsWGS_01239 [Bradybaena similaris]
MVCVLEDNQAMRDGNERQCVLLTARNCILNGINQSDASTMKVGWNRSPTLSHSEVIVIVVILLFQRSVSYAQLFKQKDGLSPIYPIISRRSSQVPHSFSSSAISHGQVWAFRSSKREHDCSMCLRVWRPFWHLHWSVSSAFNL